MLEGWREVAVGDLAEVFDGPHATPTKTDRGPWYLSISSLVNGRLDLSASAHLSEEDFPKWTKRVRPEPGDTLFSYETRLGDAAHWSADEPAALGRRMGLLRPNDKVDPAFLTYAYLGPQFQAEIQRRAIRGATVDRIPIGELPHWPILVPPLDEQRRIAGVLGALDDLIETNQRLARHLESLAQSLFDRLMGNTTPFVEMTPLSSTVEILSGGTPKTSESSYWGGDVPWFSVVDAPDDHEIWVFETAKTITNEGLAHSPARLLPVGSTILSARGTVGKTALVATPMAMNQSCYALRSLHGPRGFYNFFLTRSVVDELQRNAHGSVFDTITRATLDGVMVPDLDSGQILAFESAVAPLLDQLLALLRENQELATARDELLPLLLSGRVSVRGVAA